MTFPLSWSKSSITDVIKRILAFTITGFNLPHLKSWCFIVSLFRRGPGLEKSWAFTKQSWNGKEEVWGRLVLRKGFEQLLLDWAHISLETGEGNGYIEKWDFLGKSQAVYRVSQEHSFTQQWLRLRTFRSSHMKGFWCNKSDKQISNIWGWRPRWINCIAYVWKAFEFL